MRVHPNASGEFGRASRTSEVLLKDWSAEFVETEELKDPLPVDIEHPQVIRFVQIVFDRLKMPAVPLLCERKRNLKGHKLTGSPSSEFLKELWVVKRFV
jgi:hypothetical protein